MSFFRRWRRGMAELTPLQLLGGKRVAIVGQLVGLVFALAYLVFSGLWVWVTVVFFTLLLVFFEFLSVQKQIGRLKAFRGGL